jgi:hypothetical protein
MTLSVWQRLGATGVTAPTIVWTYVAVVARRNQLTDDELSLGMGYAAPFRSRLALTLQELVQHRGQRLAEFREEPAVS